MTNNNDRETITPDFSYLDPRPAEISIIARELRANSFGALTQREAIVRARAILAAKGGR